jgi:hypothetical protein
VLARCSHWRRLRLPQLRGETIMAGCGKLLEIDKQRFEGLTTLKCGTNLYWKIPGQNRGTKTETLLCNGCVEKKEN